jgi:hypothetical protein
MKVWTASRIARDFFLATIGKKLAKSYRIAKWRGLLHTIPNA